MANELLIERAWQLDEDGFFVRDLYDFLMVEGVIFTETECPSGAFRKPRFVNGLWIEGAPISSAELLDSEKSKAVAEINSAHDKSIKAGVLFSFNGVDDYVQTRNERDLINISGVATRAMLLKADGVTGDVIKFRAMSNTTYMISPDVAISLGSTVASYIESLYSTMWALKDAIAGATNIDDVRSIAWPQD